MPSIKIGQTGLCGAALVVALSGCNSFDPKPDEQVGGAHLVIPIDDRTAVKSDTPPPAISGGTLSITADGKSAIVADPARDLVSVVDLQTLAVKHTVNLMPGDEPGRSVEDGAKLVHVALRRSGAVVTIDPATGTVVDRQAVCKSPRGIAYEASTQLIHVACAEGKLVSLYAQTGAVARTLTLDTDLRDVLVRGSELWVTRFKSAEILRVSSAGVLGTRMTVPPGQSTLSQPAAEGPDSFVGPSTKQVTVQAGVAWRAVSNSAGGAVLVHQIAVSDDIDIVPPSTQGSAYGGGGFGCSGIVQNEVSTVAPDGTVTSTPFVGAPLPVDIALSPDGQWVAVAHAGPADQAAPRPSEIFIDPSGDAPPQPSASFGEGRPTTPVSIMSLLSINSVAGAGPGACAGFDGGGMFVDSPVPVTAVAFTPDGQLLAQTMDPPQLMVLAASQLPGGSPQIVALPGDTRLDTGHELFHRDAGGGIACASCHPEGGEDGRTWHFTDTGARRTQALHVGLRDTAPFHWNGDLPNVGALMSEVFVGRMGGVRESADRVDTLSNWLFALKAPPAIRDSADPAALRGQALFNSADVGCSTCHSGAKFTNNLSVSIDTVANKKLQVPSLVAVGYRAPFMHTGCANNLAARFDVSCGGNAHGNTAGLSPDQINDLIAFLESL
jgi:DNA-binding beta-propeller fold protein YncE